MKEAFETCTFCHRQALMTDAYRSEVEALKRRAAELEAALRAKSKKPPPPQERAA